MSVFFSRQCEYALQSVIYLAQKKQGEMTTIKEISGHLNIPFHFLGKIFQKLSHKGLLHSMKGVSGGFWLGSRNVLQVSRRMSIWRHWSSSCAPPSARNACR